MSGCSDLEQAVQHFVTAFSHLQWTPFIYSFAEQPSVFYPFEGTAERVDGTDAVAARFSAFFEEARSSRPGPDYLALDPQNLHLEVIGDAALVTFHLRNDTSLGRRSMMWVRENGQWKIKHLHASTMPGSVGDIAV